MASAQGPLAGSQPGRRPTPSGFQPCRPPRNKRVGSFTGQFRLVTLSPKPIAHPRPKRPWAVATNSKVVVHEPPIWVSPSRWPLRALQARSNKGKLAAGSLPAAAAQPRLGQLRRARRLAVDFRCVETPQLRFSLQTHNCAWGCAERARQPWIPKAHTAFPIYGCQLQLTTTAQDLA